MTKEKETVTISRELYYKLLEDSEWLNFLEIAGVDNWAGYGYAQDLRREANGEDEEDNNFDEEYEDEEIY